MWNHVTSLLCSEPCTAPVFLGKTKSSPWPTGPLWPQRPAGLTSHQAVSSCCLLPSLLRPLCEPVMHSCLRAFALNSPLCLELSFPEWRMRVGRMSGRNCPAHGARPRGHSRVEFSHYVQGGLYHQLLAVGQGLHLQLMNAG